IEQKVQKNPKLLTNAYKDLLKEYNVDYKDSDIKKSVEDTILNPEKLKEQQSSSASSGLSS
ncbi:MAG: peptidylprolyl isomerase, partial [Staphylococcus sp.]|nr:peptidylprolyl isomerase [Staphylococcus sp.]